MRDIKIKKIRRNVYEISEGLPDELKGRMEYTLYYCKKKWHVRDAYEKPVPDKDLSGAPTAYEAIGKARKALKEMLRYYKENNIKLIKREGGTDEKSD